MSTDITIEPMTETDLLLIKPLLTYLLDAMTDTEGFDIEQSIRNCRVLIADPAQYMLVARKEGTILGFVIFSIRKTVMHPGPSGLIDELVVSKNSQAMGIGKQLIQAVINKCQELGCCEVEVSTEKTNTRARRFYKTCGFEEDAVLMEFNVIQPT